MMPVTAPSNPTTVFDPLLARADLPLRRRCYPLGFAVDVWTNSERVLEAAAESWPGAAQPYAELPLRIEIGVAGDDSESPTAPPIFRSRSNLLSIVSSAEDSVVCDFGAGYAFGWVRPSTVADVSFFRYHFLEAAALALLDQLHFAPVHGALVVRTGCGVVLCGGSFAGKSTLAYACARKGWTLVSDDATYLMRNRMKLFAVGHSHMLRFRPDAPQLFPELQGRSVATRPNGKAGIEVFTRDLPEIRTAPGASIHHLVFLSRADHGSARLSAWSRAEALSWLTDASPYGQEVVRTAQRAAYERLTRLPVWRLRYSALDEAVACLDRLAVPGV